MSTILKTGVGRHGIAYFAVNVIVNNEIRMSFSRLMDVEIKGFICIYNRRSINNDTRYCRQLSYCRV